MTIGTEFDVDHASVRTGDGSTTRVRHLVIGTVLAVLLVGVLVSQLLSAPAAVDGAQSPPSGDVELEAAAVDGWVPFTPVAGELPDWRPMPMVRRSDRVCVGFARVDFGPDDVRPSLSRCEPQTGRPMAANEIRSIASIQAGFDTWHFIEAADRIESVTVRLAGGEEVSDGRFLLSDSSAALLLEIDRDLSSIEWSTGTATYRCVPEPDAWRTSVFCTPDVDR